MRSPGCRAGSRSYFTIDQSPQPSTSSRTPSMLRVQALPTGLARSATRRRLRLPCSGAPPRPFPPLRTSPPASARARTHPGCRRPPSCAAARQPPAQIRAVERPSVDAERPHRRDQVGCVAHQENAAAAPFARHAVMHTVCDLAQNLHLRAGPMKATPVAQILRGRLLAPRL